MFTSVDDRGPNLLLWDRVMVKVTKDGKRCEVVVHPAEGLDVSVRLAKEPYVCVLHLANGERVGVDLADAEDWGDIQGCLPGDCDDWKDAIGWGNDVDGHVKIVRVTDCHDRDIPLDEFRRDVRDFVIYHEA